MNTKTQYILSIMMASLVITCTEVYSQSYRENLQHSQVKVFEHLLIYIQHSEYKKAGEAFTYITPLVEGLNKEYEVKLDTAVGNAIDSKSQKLALHAVFRIIYYDMYDLLQVLSKKVGNDSTDIVTLKLTVRLAFADYLMLSKPFLDNNEVFYIDRGIKNIFRKLHQTIAKVNNGYEIYDKGIDVELIQALISSLETEVINILNYADIKL